ncbi:MAG: alpha/beta hydrolase, partial [Verrucomicrobiae bacterium]|nr:alpha/beta hydrolase [Verrucomicrobiae bacterium]
KEKHPITGAPVDNGVAPDEFRVHLVAHSMGGLICRAFLQNPALVDEIPGLSAGQKAAYEQARLAVDKLFTYATPHNGIDLRLVGNVPAWAQKFDLDNFNRKRIGEYLGLTQKGDSALKDVAVVKNFSPERVFNLVGTNPQDYTVAGGISSWAAGEASDGLVRVANATTHGTGEYGERIESPRAFVHRSHSGHYGIVNSEEGYQNLTRFLFGNVRVDGVLLVDEITLPDDVQKQKDAGKTVRASYQFEVVASVRGSQWNIHRRMVRENSAIFRTYDELFPKPAGGARKPDRTASPHLFSVFLDQSKSRQTDKPVEERSISMAFDLSVLVPDYEVDGLLFLDRHYEGGHIYRDRIILEAFPDDATPGGWKMKYGFQSKTPNQANKIADVEALPKKGGVAFEIEIEQKKHPGIHARLRIEARHWNT